MTDRTISSSVFPVKRCLNERNRDYIASALDMDGQVRLVWKPTLRWLSHVGPSVDRNRFLLLDSPDKVPLCPGETPG